MELQVNFLAVLLATLSRFAIGGIWYGPLFLKPWMKENKITEADMKKRNMPVAFGLTAILSFISALFLEMFIGPDAELGFALFASLIVGLGWIASAYGVTYLFENKSLKLFLINAGYHVVTFLVMGIVLALL